MQSFIYDPPFHCFCHSNWSHLNDDFFCSAHLNTLHIRIFSDPSKSELFCFHLDRLTRDHWRCCLTGSSSGRRSQALESSHQSGVRQDHKWLLQVSVCSEPSLVSLEMVWGVKITMERKELKQMEGFYIWNGFLVKIVQWTRYLTCKGRIARIAVAGLVRMWKNTKIAFKTNTSLLKPHLKTS